MGVITGVFTAKNAESTNSLESVARRLISGPEFFSGLWCNSADVTNSEKWVISGIGNTAAVLGKIESDGFERTISDLEGRFALLIFDREKQHLHLVRDPMGLEPLFFGKIDDGWVIADSPAKIVHAAGDDVTWMLDREGLYRYFLSGASWGKRTLFSGIERVPAGHVVSISADETVKASSFYEPKPQSDAKVENLAELMKSVTDDLPIFKSGNVGASYLASITGREAVENSEKVSREDALRKFAAATGEAFAGESTPFEIAATFQKEEMLEFSWAIGADALFLGSIDAPSPEMWHSFQTRRSGNEIPHECFATQLRHLFISPENMVQPGDFDRDLWWLRDQISPISADACATHRWTELTTRVRDFLVPMATQIGRLYDVTIHFPFLNPAVINFVLGLEERDLIAPNLGRQAPLRRHLSEQSGHPSVWDSNQADGFDSFIEAEISPTRLKVLQMLHDDGFPVFEGKTGPVMRDFKRFLSATEGFAAWSVEWIETGKVVVS